MNLKSVLSILAATILVTSCAAGAPQGAAADPDNREIREMFEADQKDRGTTEVDWEHVRHRDRERLARLRLLMAQDAFSTASDFHRAAVLFQHGEQPQDYLIAHTLAMRAVEMGREEARWIVASSLDRYLLSTDRPQFYGTQFELDDEGHAVPRPLTENVDAASMRAALGIEPELYERRRELVEPYLRAKGTR